jgi:hypothetical protein
MRHRGVDRTVLLLMGKVSKGVGALSARIGKFATAVGKAGGGWSGFLSVLPSLLPCGWRSPRQVVAGTVALVDYVSGAKQAREALEGMNETAKKLKTPPPKPSMARAKGCPSSAWVRRTSPRSTIRRGWLDGLLKVGRTGEGIG